MVCRLLHLSTGSPTAFSPSAGETNPVEELLVKLYRGQTFGETALDNEKGKRTAGAKASQPTYLLSLDVTDYKRIFFNYKVQLKNEVLSICSSFPMSFTHWSPTQSLTTHSQSHLLPHSLSHPLSHPLSHALSHSLPGQRAALHQRCLQHMGEGRH